MPERYEFEFGLSRTKGRRTRRDVRKRMLVIGDFSGAAGQRAPLEERPLPQVDIDNLDALIKRIGPRLDLPAGMLAFTQLDDFGPDRLFADMEVFQSLRQARTNPGAGHDELLGGLLGSPAGQATATTRPLPVRFDRTRTGRFSTGPVRNGANASLSGVDNKPAPVPANTIPRAPSATRAFAIARLGCTYE